MSDFDSGRVMVIRQDCLKRFSYPEETTKWEFKHAYHDTDEVGSLAFVPSGLGVDSAPQAWVLEVVKTWIM